MSTPPTPDTASCVCQSERAAAVEAATAAYNAAGAVAAREAAQRAALESHYWRAISAWTQDHSVNASSSISVPVANIGTDTAAAWTTALESLGYVVTTANGSLMVSMAPAQVTPPLAEA